MNPASVTSGAPAYVRKNRLRQDANRIALSAIRSILNAAKPTRVDIEGTIIEIRTSRLRQEAWSHNAWGLDETQDGPWPRSVQFDCSWPGGKTQLVASAMLAGKPYDHFVALEISSPRADQQLVWINVAALLREDVEWEAPITASASLNTRKPQDDEGKKRRKRRREKIITLLGRSKLPLASRAGMDAFRISLNDGRVFPSPDEAIHNLVHLALLKLPIWVKNQRDAIDGEPYLDPDAHVPGEDDVAPELDDATDTEDDASIESEAQEDTRVDDIQANPQTAASPVKPYSIDDIISDGCFIERSKLDAMLARLRTKKNLILQGPPGTGKSWLAKRLGFALMGQQDHKRLRAVQFHPNLSYEDFVRGHRPASGGTLELVDGPFLEMIATAQASPGAIHVFVIEEINRGNPAQIFGEMLTLLEGDKRKAEEALELCYRRHAGERIHIPDNVFVIGTMNIADRSIAPLDMALRRRFAFIDLQPCFGALWHNWVRDNGKVPADILADIEKRLQTLNDEIAKDKKLGRHFCIGHSFVTPYEVVPNADDWFRGIVETEIGPVLDEYWFDDLETARKAKERLLKGS